MLGPDRRFRDPNPEEIAALDLEGMRTAVMRQIHAGNVEVRAPGGRRRVRAHMHCQYDRLHGRGLQGRRARCTRCSALSLLPRAPPRRAGLRGG